jgi:hypothetical protein
VAESALAVRTRERYDLVQGLKAQGKGIKPIVRETGVHSRGLGDTPTYRGT